MAQVDDYVTTPITVGDLFQRFGDIPLHRIVRDPAPGTATVEDVVRLDDHHDKLCELVDGTLIEKAMGAFESLLAVRLVALLHNCIENANLGIVLAPDGMMQIFPNQVRIPDVSFISWEGLKDSGFPDKPAPDMAPTLAVEVISKSNTPREMERKLAEYFEAGSQLVWYVYPKEKQVKAYTSPTDETTLGETDTLTGGELLPGLTIDLKEFFKPPIDPAKVDQSPK